jgi:hypothetical protein
VVTTGPFCPGEIDPGTYWIGGWVGPRAGQDAVEKIKILPLSGIVLKAYITNGERISVEFSKELL